MSVCINVKCDRVSTMQCSYVRSASHAFDWYEMKKLLFFVACVVVFEQVERQRVERSVETPLKCNTFDALAMQ